MKSCGWLAKPGGSQARQAGERGGRLRHAKQPGCDAPDEAHFGQVARALQPRRQQAPARGPRPTRSQTRAKECRPNSSTGFKAYFRVVAFKR